MRISNPLLTLPNPALTAMHRGNPHGLRFADGDGGEKGAGGSDKDGGSGGSGRGEDGSEGGREDGKEGKKGDGPVLNEHGFPDKTPLEKMTVEQREAYWKYHSRKWEGIANQRKDYDDVVAERDRLRKEKMSPDERAQAEYEEKIRAAARAEERKVWVTRLVETEVRSALRARKVPDDKIKSLVEVLDHSKFIAENGEVDTDRVTKYASGFGSGNWPDMGQGHRGDSGSGKSTVESAKQEYLERRRKATATS